MGLKGNSSLMPMLMAMVLAIFMLPVSLPTEAQARTQVSGTITHGNNPLARVRVDFFGPEKRVLLTDANGKYSINLRGGVYILRVSSGMRRFETEQSINANGTQTVNVRVTWP